SDERLVHAGEHAEQRRLAARVRADDHRDAARGEVEIEVFDHPPAGVAGGEPAGAEARCGCGGHRVRPFDVARSQRRKTAPMAPVTTPTGTDRPGSANCATRSAAASRQAPTAALVPMPMAPWPSIGRAIAGAHSAMKPMGPTNAHVTAVSSTAVSTVTTRTREASTPSEAAVGAPICVIGSQRAQATTAGMQRTTTTSTVTTLHQGVDERLPVSQI